MPHKWVESDGGPLIVVPESVSQNWSGTTSLGSDTPTDYDRACVVEGYAGLIDVGECSALVLGDDPASTTFLPERNTFLRVIASDREDEELVRIVLERLPEIELLDGPE